MPTVYRHFRIAFWEDDHAKVHAALHHEYDDSTEAEAEIERQLSAGNYAIARLYGWEESRKIWIELNAFPAQNHARHH